jgi:hypothetical protein
LIFAIICRLNYCNLQNSWPGCEMLRNIWLTYLFFTFLMLLKLLNITQVLDRLWGFQEVEASRFHDSRHMKMVRLLALRTSFLPPGIFPGGRDDRCSTIIKRKAKLPLCMSWRHQTYNSILYSPRH